MLFVVTLSQAHLIVGGSMNRCYSKCRAVLLGVSIMVLAGFTQIKSQEVADEAQLQLYLGVGSGNFRLGTLNDAVVEKGFTEFDRRPVMLEIGTHFLIQQLVLDGGVGTVLWKTLKVDNSRVSLLGGYSQISLGVNFVLPGEAWQLYPFFTLGVGLYRYSMSETYDFDANRMASPDQRASTFWMPTFITGTGGALYYTAYNPEKTHAFTIGIRGGVLMDPTPQNSWYKEGAKYRNGPAPLFAGPYLQFVIANGRYFR